MQATHFFNADIRKDADLDGAGTNVPDVFALILKKLHLAGSKFAIGFPGMNGVAFGARMQVFGSAREIEFLRKRISGGALSDYVQFGDVCEVAPGDGFECFRMLRVKSTASRDKRRKMRFDAGKNTCGSYQQEDIDAIQRKNQSLAKLPFLRVTSQSNSNQFKLFIVRENCGFSDGEPNG